MARRMSAAKGAAVVDDIVAAAQKEISKVRREAEVEIVRLREEVYQLSAAFGMANDRAERRELLHRLREWQLAAQSGDPSAAERMTIEIERSYRCDGVLVVTDMSGFTRVTREEGIGHFLMLIKQMQSICIPIFEKHGGTLVKVEADDLFVVFSHAQKTLRAIRASIAVMQAVRAFSDGKPKNDRVVMSMGLIAGSFWCVPGLDVFGGVVPLGFHLGEDAAVCAAHARSLARTSTPYTHARTRAHRHTSPHAYAAVGHDPGGPFGVREGSLGAQGGRRLR